MSKINELIKELCPNGIEYRKLIEIGETFTGLSGKNKNDFESGNNRYITYTNIYNNPAVKLDIDDFVYIKENEKQNYIMKGDILITGSSENMEDSGMISIVMEQPKEKIYLNSFCFGFRLNEKYKNKIIPSYAKHIFRSTYFRNQILKCSFGVTRYNLNKKMFLNLNIPIPPIEIQEEISGILDKFSKLEAELEAELEARKQQYEYWRSNIFDKDMKYYRLDEICDICAGGTPTKSKSEYWNNGSIKWLGSTVCKNQKNVDDVTDYITELGLQKSSAKLLKKETTLIAMVGATIGKVSFLNFEACTNQNVAALYPKDVDKLNTSYLYYACRNLYEKFLDFANGKFAMASLSYIKSLEIPVPSIKEQEKIVNILDKFEKLTKDISEGLPAEIELRRKQYEYYRDKLLSFEELK